MERGVFNVHVIYRIDGDNKSGGYPGFGFIGSSETRAGRRGNCLGSR
jgi:hypothetical protein